MGLASRVIDGIMEARDEASILFPRSGGNIHCFTALTPCAILDVLSPPYSEDFGRPSTYFSDYPIPSLPGKLFFFLFLPNNSSFLPIQIKPRSKFEQSCVPYICTQVMRGLRKNHSQVT